MVTGADLDLELEGAAAAGVDEAALRRVVDLVLREVGVDEPCALGIAFVDEARMRELNEAHRGRAAVTDVLSFPIDELDPLPPGLERQLGDVVICPAQVGRQAAAAAVEPSVELTTMVVHGLLHLAGLDHETDRGEMLARQAALCAVAPSIGWRAQ